MAIIAILLTVVVGIHPTVKTLEVVYKLTGVEEFDRTVTLIKWEAIIHIPCWNFAPFNHVICWIMVFSKPPEEQVES